MVLSSATVVNAGVDTLVLNAFYTVDGRPVKREIDTSLAQQLDLWKRDAQATHAPVLTGWVFQGQPFMMHPHGVTGGQWQWMVKTSDVSLYISAGHWNSIASVRLGANYLWSSANLLSALQHVHSWLNSVFANAMYLQVSAVDLCVDVAGWHDITSLDRCHHFVSHSRKRAEHYQSEKTQDSSQDDGLHLTQTGFDFSKRGVMSCTIYNKTRELAVSGKAYFLDLWRLRGWSPEDGEVWRVEMKYRRQVLHELKTATFHGIDDAYELVERLPVLWAYAVGHPTRGDDGVPDGWLRCVLPSEDSNRARWPTHPVWRLLQTAFMKTPARPDHFGRLVRKPRKQHDIEKGITSLLGYSTTVAAWVMARDGDEPLDFSMFLHWLMEHGEAFLQAQGRTFAEEVQQKRQQLENE